MNLHNRLKAVDRERGRRCTACGGLLAPVGAPRKRTWRSIMAEFRELPEEEVISMHAAYNKMAELPPALQEKAYRMYCEQQGIEYDSSKAKYSGENPPPAPWFPESEC
jgi:hypothetical protein